MLLIFLFHFCSVIFLLFYSYYLICIMIQDGFLDACQYMLQFYSIIIFNDEIKYEILLLLNIHVHR